MLSPSVLTPDTAQLRRLFKSDAVYDVLVNESVAQAGPYDGACLICARAIIDAANGGELVRIVSDVRRSQTEHYGALINGVIYDAEGAYRTPGRWFRQLARLERIFDRTFSLSIGSDPASCIPDDPAAQAKLARLIAPAFRRGYVDPV